MYIISINFPNSGKTYDYLYVNPKKVSVDVRKPLLSVTGGSRSGECHAEMRIAGISKIDYLPSHVTSQIEVGSGNTCIVSRIAAGRSERPGSSSGIPAPKERMPAAPAAKNRIDAIRKKAMVSTMAFFKSIRKGV